ncbi:MAG: hypothetical protein RIS47_189, partial [Bacteroidota bacterium]
NYRNNHAYRNVYADKTGQNYGENDDRLIVDLLNENTLNYTFDIGKHSFTTLAGFTQQRTNTHTAGVYGTNFPTDYIETLNAATIIDAKQTYTSLEEVALTSYLGRINYAYDNKYMFSVALRTDGSSLFGPQNKWGWFPSVSFGWNVVDENFFASLKDKVNKLKLRLSMGVSGNNDIENYAHVNRLYPSNYSLGAGNGTVTAGVGQTGTVLANPAISWEQSTEYNGGLDLGVLNDRITMSLDYYYSTTNQLLLKQNVAGYTGYEKFWNNVGNVENKGFELEFSTFNIRSKDFSWKSSFNISANSNRLLSLGGESQFISVGERSEQYLAKVGESSIQFYGYKMIGVWQTSAELAANPHSNDDAVGGIRVADTNNDNKIDADDRVTLGSPFPKFNWGFSNNFEYKSFDLSFMFQGSQGAKIFYGDGYYTEMRYLQKELVDGRWFSEGFAATAPREKLGRDWLLTDYLIRDASYVVLRDVLLGYTLPKKISKKIGLSKLRMYCSAQNLLYFMADDYIGINPEAVNTTSNYASPLIDGYQRGAYPLVRTITLGLDIKF